MRIFKNIVWIVLLTVIQTTFGQLIKIHEIVPNLLAVYSVAVAYLCKKDKEAIYVMLTCGIISGSCVGHMFPVDVLIIGIGSIMVRLVSDYLRFIPRFINVHFSVLIMAAALAAAEYFVINHTLDINALLNDILPYAVYTLAASCVIYPLIIKTMFKKTEKKLMVI